MEAQKSLKGFMRNYEQLAFKNKMHFARRKSLRGINEGKMRARPKPGQLKTEVSTLSQERFSKCVCRISVHSSSSVTQANRLHRKL